jgi:putative FmdB family regulatory protein
MPVYDYRCQEHGLFHDLQTLENHAEPCACPVCGRLSARIIMVPPELLLMNSDTRKAFSKNEKARHEPLISSKEQRQQDTQHQKHCGCHKTVNKSKLWFTAQGDKMFPSMRPWMISH